MTPQAGLAGFNRMTIGSLALVALFSSTLFLSAALLFSVQPMVSRMLLPLLGGTPAVWNTSTVFFQALLLGGYGYAHIVSSRFGAKWQIAVHSVLLVAAGLTLPLTISENGLLARGVESDPTLWLLGALAFSVGLPFFVLATTAPFLQRCFSRTAHRWAADPYFLYAASNLGSLMALLGYPLWLESEFRLSEQSSIWAFGYGCFGVAVLSCLVAGWVGRSAERFPSAPVSSGAERGDQDEQSQSAVWTARLRWLFFAFVPSSLLLGVTTYLTTDIASIALLWVVPLALYLVTYIIAFGSSNCRLESQVARALPAGAVALIFLLVSEATQPGWLLILVHLLFFFIASLACHMRLARERPASHRLTEFYFWISAGGVLGGAFNALAAPHLFDRVLEYPIVILLACLVRRGGGASDRMADRVRDWVWPAGLGAGTVLLIWLLSGNEWLGPQLRIGLIFGIPIIASYLFVERPVRFALGLAAILAASGFYLGTHGRTLHVERNFFGVLRVTLDPSGESRRLIHGNTIHGQQYVDSKRQGEPLSYYHRAGPLGDIFRAFGDRPAGARIAVVGLGTGSILTYARSHEQWTYYEINPAVCDIAWNTNFFTFVRQSAPEALNVVIGDARFRLREAADSAYDLIVLDAFSSDAIPVHLITREAIELYLRKLADGGLLVFHISNRWLDLEPVLGDLARGASLVCHAHEEMTISEWEQRAGKVESHWVVMARRREDLGALVKDCRWLPVNPRAEPEIWSDDFCNLLEAIRWW